MAYVTENTYTGNGSTVLYSFTFPYLETTDIKVTVAEEARTQGSGATQWTLPNATQIQFNTAPTNGQAIRIYRDTDIDNLKAEFFAGSAIRSQDLNEDFLQNLYNSQEAEAAIDQKWEKGTATLDSTEAFVDSNDKIMTAAAIDDRINANIAVQPLADGKILAGNGSGVAAAVTPSGDVTMANTGAFTIATGAVEHAMLAADAVDGDNIQDDVINSEHIAAGAIDLEHMSSASVDSDNIVNDTIVNADINSSAAIAHSKLANITNGQILVGNGSNVPTAVAVSGDVTLANDGAVTIANDAVEQAMIADDAVGADQLASNAVVNDSVASGAAIAHSKLASVTDGQILIGNGSNVPTAVAVSGDVTIANTGAVTIANDAVEIGMIGCEQTTISDSDSHIPTSGAVIDYVTSVIAPIGGLEVIADDESFPNTIPAAGVVISITDAAGLQVNSSGVSTNGDALDNSTITINGFPSELRGGVGSNPDPYVFQSGAGLMVVSTGSSHTYNYHQAMIRESDFVQLSDDINDFNNRYRIGTRTANSASSNDDGDLFFDTGTNKMYVYDGAYDAGGEWKEVTSAGDYKFLTIKDHDQAVGGSGPTYGSNVEFDLFDGSADASITSAAQLIVVLNGVIQKPNAAYDGSMEGFSLNDTHGIKFATAPPSGSSMFVTQIGTATTISTPGTGSISNANMFAAGVINAAAIGTGAVEHAKLAADAVDGDNIADDSLNSEHYVAASIDHEHLANDCVDGDNLADNAVDSEHYTDGSIDEAHIADNQVTLAKMAGLARGKIIYGNASGDPAALTVGSANQVLTSDGTDISWAAASSGVTSDANSNTLAGTNAGTNITAGQGIQNSLYGYNAGNDITTGDHNACFGMGCGEEIDTGSDNVAIGYYALSEVTSQGNNVAIGYKALEDATADNNTAIGMGAMKDHTTGEDNVAIGINALQNGTSAQRNIIIGSYAGDALTECEGAVAIGYNALSSNTTANATVAIGLEAFEDLNGGAESVAIGNKAGSKCTGGTGWTIMGGYAADIGIGTGDHNTIIGYAAGRDITSGERNTFVGSNCDDEITTGDHNTGVGAYACNKVKTGDHNTAIGSGALSETNDSSSQNTCVGSTAGSAVSSGSNNVLIGYQAGTGSSPGGAINTDSNCLVLGNDQISAFFCNDTSIDSSDERDKTDITNYTQGLSFIKALRPVTYRWDKRSWYNDYSEKGELVKENARDGSKKRAQKHVGFLSQEVLQVEKDHGSGSNNEDMLVVGHQPDNYAYGLKYARLIPMLVNSIKELSAEVDTLKTKVAALEAK